MKLIGDGLEHNREEDFQEMSDDNPELRQDQLFRMQQNIDSKRQSFIDNLPDQNA